MGSRVRAKLGRTLQALRLGWQVYIKGRNKQGCSSLAGVWIDVGAYLGTETFPAAKQNPRLQVYAFEPNLRLAAQYWGLFPNITVLPVAVSETDGFGDFYINDNVGSSSILPHNPEGVRRWIGGHLFKVESKVPVPTVRLDTFMAWAGISKVEYLKIDAQGADFSVVKSAGERVRDIKKIKLEVAVTPVSPYDGAARRVDVVNYLESFGFVLTDVERQFHGQEENLTFVSGDI
jgi:FkbM family methyltransferase